MSEQGPNYTDQILDYNRELDQRLFRNRSWANSARRFADDLDTAGSLTKARMVRRLADELVDVSERLVRANSLTELAAEDPGRTDKSGFVNTRQNTSCAVTFGPGGKYLYRCTRPAGHAGAHTQSEDLPEPIPNYMKTSRDVVRRKGIESTTWTEWTSLANIFSPNVPSIGSRDMGGDLR